MAPKPQEVLLKIRDGYERALDDHICRGQVFSVPKHEFLSRETINYEEQRQLESWATLNHLIPIDFFIFSDNKLIAHMRKALYTHVLQGDESFEIYLDSFCAGIARLNQGTYTVVNSSPAYIFQFNGVGGMEVYDAEGGKLQDTNLVIAHIPIKDGNVHLERRQDLLSMIYGPYVSMPSSMYPSSESSAASVDVGQVAVSGEKVFKPTLANTIPMLCAIIGNFEQGNVTDFRLFLRENYSVTNGHAKALSAVITKISHSTESVEAVLWSHLEKCAVCSASYPEYTFNYRGFCNHLENVL